MKKASRLICLAFVYSVCSVILSSYSTSSTPNGSFVFPYKQAGLTERQAAAHLLSRFTFGATPGDIDEVVNMGLENWFQKQLNGSLADDSLNKMLEGYEALKMSNEQIVKTYPRGGQILRMAVRDGYINKDSVANGKKDNRKELVAYMKEKGYKQPADLMRQLINQKILRATYSNNQLRELLTDFWFNHFNVSLTKNDCAPFVVAYERDAIRPNVIGSFETILMATAKSPAMLTYLDNFRSSSANDEMGPNEKQMEKRMMKKLEERQSMDTSMEKMQVVQKLKNAKKAQGLNENYAREIMELHTLGVDGGYTQTDVTQAARVLTGWTIFPMERYGAQLNQLEKRNEEFLKRQGFVREGDFVFAANKHDKGEKKVLGTVFPAGGGYEEGQKLIRMLAHHSATAKFISTKLAVRFVNDNPSQTLVDKMAKTFSGTGGQISKVLIAMATSPEFWDAKALREKTKSPFELAISSVRSLDADVNTPFQLFTWITKMGEKIYYYQAPTGFPDRGDYWINTGSLLNRMNFGLALAAQRIPGIRFNLAALNKNREPESAEAALVTYTKLLMPERNVDQTIKRLTPFLNDRNIEEKVGAAAEKTPIPGNSVMMEEDETMADVADKPGKLKDKPAKKNSKDNYTTMQMQSAKGNNSMLAQVVGIIIGSPEFQRK